jgi:phage shock protein PspC (stress-responsive transcriptional regulator)
MNLSERLFAAAGIERRFRRNYRAGIVMGVCAGLADTLGIDRNVLRFVALLLVWFATVPALLLYLLLAWLGDA